MVFKAKDASGLLSSVVFVHVEVMPPTPPVIICSSATVFWEAVLGPFLVPACTISDKVDGDLTSRLRTDTSVVDRHVTGSYILQHWMDGVDTQGLQAAPHNMSVIVHDTTAPVRVLNITQSLIMMILASDAHWACYTRHGSRQQLS